MLDQLDVRIRSAMSRRVSSPSCSNRTSFPQGACGSSPSSGSISPTCQLEDSEREDRRAHGAAVGPHRIAPRHRPANNQLLLQEQDEVADALGYGDDLRRRRLLKQPGPSPGSRTRCCT